MHRCVMQQCDGDDVQGGLVVVDAKYGVLEAILKAEAEDRERLQSRDIGEVANGEQAASASHAESNMDGESFDSNA